MRNNYSNDNYALAWGNDRFFGLFVQVFDLKSEDEDLLVSFDQCSRNIHSDKFLTKSKFFEICDKYGFEEPKEDYAIFEKTSLAEPYTGYLYDENDYHDGGTFLTTFEEFQNFFTKVNETKKKFKLTDLFDCLVMESK